MIGRILAAAVVALGCSLAGVQATAATTESEVVLPPTPTAEVPSTILEMLPLEQPGETQPEEPDTAASGSPAAEEPSASESPSPSPSPDAAEPEPTPTDAEGSPEPAATAGVDDTTEAPAGGASVADPGEEVASTATEIVRPVSAEPLSAPSGPGETPVVPEPIPAAVPAPDSAGDLPNPGSLVEPSPEIEPPAPEPLPSRAPVPVDLAADEDVRTAVASGVSAPPRATAGEPKIGQQAGATGAPSTRQACQPAPQATPSTDGLAEVKSATILALGPWSPRMAWATNEPADLGKTTSEGPLSAIEHTAVTGAGIAALMGQRVSAVSVAVDFARSSGGWAGPLVFNVWLRRQLRERRMSQRQLGMLSGVNHSAISRLINGRASPTLQTATKLVHALHMDWTGDQIATYFDLLPEHTLLPTQRVESALRGDGTLSDAEVRAIMQHYLALRARRKRASDAPGTSVRGRRPELPPAVGDD